MTWRTTNYLLKTCPCPENITSSNMTRTGRRTTTPIIFMVSATTLKMIVELKMLSCRYTGLYTTSHMLTGTADSSTYALGTFASNPPSGREEKYRDSRESSTQT